MTPSLSFIICTERGYLEPMSVLFAMSLRTFGGALSSAPVFSFQPRPGYQISEETHRALADLDVEHHEILLNTRYSNDPLANKPLTAAFAEKELNHEYLVFADSDQIILNEPSALCLPAGFDVGLGLFIRRMLERTERATRIIHTGKNYIPCLRLMNILTCIPL